MDFSRPVCTMDDHGGTFYGTTPAAEIVNKNKTFRAVNILIRKGMGYTAVLATVATWSKKELL